MPPAIAKTVLITTQCSGGCSHCPFSNSRLEKLFLEPLVVRKIVNQALGELTILSGGEPFEHPKMEEILIQLGQLESPFRIATGGFIHLEPWIEKLRILSRPHRPLQGISMGTDVLSSRVNHPKSVAIWKSNLQLFSEFQIPYSLTFTLGSSLEFTHFDLWSWTKEFAGKPQFLYLRYSEELSVQEWLLKLKHTFGSIPIIQDNMLLVGEP